ncbi:MAG: helix-turn-helix domain-containing protein [Gemmatimonadaceae bacterium]|nr:helix-turn-helix domain-containing protein [Gemmatimonadaceae bacterium]
MPRPAVLPPIPVAVLILPSVVPFDLAVPMQVFGYPRPDDGAQRYRVTLCTPRPGLIRSSSGFSVRVTRGLSALKDAHTIVLPGIDDLDVHPPPATVRALQASAARGARFVSICTGAFVLADAGLLAGRRATTHWMDAPLLKARYPDVTVDSDVLYVDDGQVLTSAGIACGIDLCLHVVRLDHGAAVAATVARRMVVAPHREGSQAQFVARTVDAEDNGGLEGTCIWARARLAQALTVAQMARHAGIAERTFSRRFRAEIGTSPLQWLLGERLLLARELIETTTLPLSRIASRCGLGSEVSLRQHFRRRFRISPSAYRRSFVASAPAR